MMWAFRDAGIIELVIDMMELQTVTLITSISSNNNKVVLK